MITTHNVEVNAAFTTPQFWLLWIVLCTNVTAGIGIIEQASPDDSGIIQRRPSGPWPPADLWACSACSTWAGDFSGRPFRTTSAAKPTYFIFFALGAVLYFFLPQTGAQSLEQRDALRQPSPVMLLSMYGGGFATIPAYLRDMFGTYNVSAIHGRLLTAWSVAGVLGPVLVNYMREYRNPAWRRQSQRLSKRAARDGRTLLVVGFIANLMVRPVAEKYWLAEKSDSCRRIA